MASGPPSILHPTASAGAVSFTIFVRAARVAQKGVTRIGKQFPLNALRVKKDGVKVDTTE